MKLLYLILISIGIYFFQFLILPFFNIHFNLFISFAFGFFLYYRKISRIIFISAVFDVFSGLPFPIMTVSLSLTFGALLILYTRISEDSVLMKLIVVLPAAVIFYWFFVYLTGLGFGLFEEYFHIPFRLIFNLDLIPSAIYSIIVGVVFYLILKRFSPKSLIYA